MSNPEVIEKQVGDMHFFLKLYFKHLQNQPHTR